MKKNTVIFTLVAVLACVSCDKTLNLADKFGEYQNDNPTEEQTPEQEPGQEGESTEGFTDMGDFLMSDREDVTVNEGIPRKGYWLDGKISVAKLSGDDTYTIFWSSDASLMQKGCSSPWLESNINSLSDNMVVIGNTVSPTAGFTDGGQWFIGVHELNANGRLVGFFHAESHWPGEAGAYKSIGVAYSDDGGATWTAGDKIISGPDPKPEHSANDGSSYGLGDGCVVRNAERNSWICYYSGYCDAEHDFVISMAESTDAEGRAGTWKKWDGTDFTAVGCNQETGLGDANTSIAGLSRFHGGNPSVMFNSFLDKWVMVYHRWGSVPTIVMAFSEDGITWTDAKEIIDTKSEPGGSMYPNLISEEGDLTGGQNVRMYYSTDMVNGIRTLSFRKISFK